MPASAGNTWLARMPLPPTEGQQVMPIRNELRETGGACGIVKDYWPTVAPATNFR